MHEGPMKCRLKTLIKMCEGFIHFVYLFIWICLIYIEISVAIKNAEHYHSIDENVFGQVDEKPFLIGFIWVHLNFDTPSISSEMGEISWKDREKKTTKIFLMESHLIRFHALFVVWLFAQDILTHRHKKKLSDGRWRKKLVDVRKCGEDFAMFEITMVKCWHRWVEGT